VRFAASAAALVLFSGSLCGCSDDTWNPADYSESGFVEALGPDFALGAATSPHQIEGGNDNDWTEWERTSYPDGRPHVKTGEPSGLACDSWNQWRRDIELLEELGLRHYRVGIEWSRLMPAPGIWDTQAAEHYRQVLQGLRGANIEPLVTLWHFSLPRWFAERGGWEHPQARADFEAYAVRAAESFGDLVDEWVTMNEPNVYAVQGYVDGVWPPGVSDPRRGARVLAELLRAHADAYALLKQHDQVDASGDGRPCIVGFAHHARVFKPATLNSLDEAVARASDTFFNQSVPDAVASGKIHISVPGKIEIDERYVGLEGAWDFFGLNYYTRDHLRSDLAASSLSRRYVPEGLPRSDLGWEIYPQGLLELLERYARYDLPVVVLENGLADAGDERRADFIRLHLDALARAARAGVRVTGYYHWSLLDNFEWAEGYVPRFGLFAVDFTASERPRTRRESARVIQSLARALDEQSR